MAYPTLAIANHLIRHAENLGVRMSPMKLQKLVYYANGWSLALQGKPLIDEQVEAWPFGPVVPSLYRAFRRYGNSEITSPGTRVVKKASVDDGETRETVVPDLSDDDPADRFPISLLNRIWDVYGKYSAVQLSNKTHAEGSPWKQVYDRYEGQIPRGTDIPADLLQNYFGAMARAEVRS